MIGTMIRNQPFGMIARAARSGVRTGLVPARGRSFRLDGRRLLAALLIFAVLIMSAAHAPGPQQWLEGDSAASVQSSSEISKAPADDGAPAKPFMAGLCSGHCASHAIALPAAFTQSISVYVKRAVWRVADDQGSQSARASRLDRPPRV